MAKVIQYEMIPAAFFIAIRALVREWQAVATRGATLLKVDIDRQYGTIYTM
jgi:hypothetical protein